MMGERIVYASEAKKSEFLIHFKIFETVLHIDHNFEMMKFRRTVILEEATPKNDDFLRLRWEELLTRKYQSIEFCANKHF